MRSGFFSSIAAAAVSIAASVAQAAPMILLSDDFNTENGGVGSAEYSGFANWSAANVDLLAPGYFFNLCQLAGGTTPCLDMEGSGNGSLTTKTAFDFAPGPVTMQFDLAGDQRNRSGNIVTVSLISITGSTLFSEIFTLPSDADFTTFTRTVNLAATTTGRLQFLSGGPADSMGMLLDNVSLSSGVATVPEPASIALLASGLAALGWMIRTKQRNA